jgi:toxin ParE1/3/4
LNVVWLPTAIANLEAQLAYIAEDDPKAAIEQGDRIEHQVMQLVEYPAMGRPGKRKGTRELVISHTPFIVVYRLKPRSQRIDLLRVLHSAQQWPPLAQ